MKKVLFIAYYFPPTGGAGVQRSVKFVRYLPENGFLPIVLTGPGPMNDRWTPADHTFLSEIPKEVKVYRVSKQFNRKSNRIISKLKYYFLLPDEFSSWWIKEAYELGVEMLNKEKVDVIFATMSPFESAVIAERLSNRFAIPWVADLRDPWALDEMQAYPTYFHWLHERNKMGAFLKKTSGIVMNTPEATNKLFKHFPSLRNNLVTTITNGFDKNNFLTPVKKRDESIFRIVHTGYLHTELGLTNKRQRIFRKFLGGIRTPVDIMTRSHYYLLKALEIILSEKVIPSNKLEVVFVGVTSEADKEIVRNSDFPNIIHFTGYQIHSDSLNYIRTADLLFLPMHNLPQGHRASIVPAKTYEYMASGNPISAAIPDGDAKDFLIDYGNVYIARPDNITEIADGIKIAYSDWKTNKVNSKLNMQSTTKFERGLLTRHLSEFFRDVLNLENINH